MSRSLKKGPFVEAKLFSRIEAMNEKGEKKVLKKACSGICNRGYGWTQAR